MNKYLRQLFTAVIALFVILGLSTTTISVFRANSLASDARNRRSYYKEFTAWRGSILASDGSTIASSSESNDAFEYQRSYEDGEVYAAVSGYFSISQGADRGIEASRDQLLNGASNSLLFDQLRMLLTGSEIRGATIETSINPSLQQTAYNALSKYEGALVAIEPSTGRILAMVSTPSYDPNTLAVHDTAAVNTTYSDLVNSEGNPMLNRAISELYPAGSTFKTVVAACALETGEYDANSMIDAGSSYTLPGTSVNLTNSSTAANGVNGEISFTNALAYSSNTAFAQLGVSLGLSAVREQAEKFGFNTSITVDKSDADSIAMTSVSSVFPKSMTEDRLALASIGQGDLLITPLQNAMIAAAIANDGVLMQPTLVDRTRSSDLSVIASTTPTVYSNAMSAESAHTLTEMMEAVISKSYPSLMIDGVSIAAKSGTAQIGENNESTDAWMMGFAPADNPQIALAVVIHDVSVFGGAIAGPIMRSVIQEALSQ